MAQRLKQCVLVAAMWLGRNNRSRLQNFVSLGRAESMLTKFRNMSTNQSPQEERFSFAFPPELKILFLVFPATFETRQSGGMEIVQYQLQLLPLVPSECLTQSCVNFLEFRGWPPMQNNMLDEFYSKYAEKRTTEEWLDNHDFASTIADDDKSSGDAYEEARSLTTYFPESICQTSPSMRAMHA